MSPDSSTATGTEAMPSPASGARTTPASGLAPASPDAAAPAPGPQGPGASAPRSTPALRLLTAGIGVAVAAVFGAILLTLDRGFDWTDEGFVYVMTASNREASGDFWGFQHLLHPLYELLGSSVLGFRVVRLLGYVALSVALTAMARSVAGAVGLRLSRAGWVLVLLVAQVGTFAAWSYPPRYLGYNELSSWLTQLGGATLVVLLLRGRAAADAPARHRSVLLLWGLVGFLLGGLVLAKITAALVFAVLALIVAVLPAHGPGRWTRIGLAAAGGASSVLVMLATGAPVLSYVRSVGGLFLDAEARAASGYSLSSLLMVYLSSASLTLGALAVPVVLAAAVLVAGRGVFGGPRPGGSVDAAVGSRAAAPVEHVALVLAGLLALIVVSVPVFPPGGANPWDAMGIALTFAFFVAVLAFAVLSPRVLPAGLLTGRRALTTAVLLALFALTPLVSGLGTNNALFGHTVFSATLWAVGAGVGLVALWQRSATVPPAVRAIPLVLLSAIVAASGVAVAGDILVHPYRTQLYLTQTSEVTVSHLRGLRLTEEEARLAAWLDATSERLGAADVPAVSVASPGALLAFNANSWANPWPGPDWAASIARACHDEGPDGPEDLIVLLSAGQEAGVGTFDQFRGGLADCGLGFPDDFEQVAAHESSTPGLGVTVWRLR